MDGCFDFEDDNVYSPSTSLRIWTIVTVYFAAAVLFLFTFLLGCQSGLNTIVMFMLVAGSGFDLIGVVLLLSKNPTDWQQQVLKPIGIGFLIIAWSLLALAGLEHLCWRSALIPNTYASTHDKAALRRIMLRVWFVLTVIVICCHVAFQLLEITLAWQLLTTLFMLWIYSGLAIYSKYLFWNLLKVVGTLTMMSAIVTYIAFRFFCRKVITDMTATALNYMYDPCQQQLLLRNEDQACLVVFHDITYPALYNALMGIGAYLLGTAEYFDPLEMPCSQTNREAGDHSDGDTVMTFEDRDDEGNDDNDDNASKHGNENSHNNDEEMVLDDPSITLDETQTDSMFYTSFSQEKDDEHEQQEQAHL